MHNPTFQRQGAPVRIGFTIGRAPLALRGIRFADGEEGAPPAAPPAAAPVPSPADVAAQHAARTNPGTPATPAAPTVQQVQGFTPEQVQKLMTDADAKGKAAADAQAELAKVQEERDALQAQVAQHARVDAVTKASAGKANAALLLDSASFLASLKDLDVTDAAKLGASIEAFVKDNPAYAAAPQIPQTSGGTPAGGSTTKPNTLEGAIAARLAG